MQALLLALLAFQASPPTTAQPLAARACTAQPNQVATERLQFDSAAFRFTGRLAAMPSESGQYVPAAVIGLTSTSPPQDISIYLARRPATPQRFDVTQRRVVGGEMRDRQILGHVPAAESVEFEIEVAGDQATFKIGELRTTVPLQGMVPTAIDLSCGSGTFQFDNLALQMNGQPAVRTAAASSTATADSGQAGRSEVTCRSYEVLGSRLTRRRVCLTAEEWVQHENSLGQMRRDMQNRNPGVTGRR